VKVWLIYWCTDSNDPSPSCLGAWSTRELAEAEVERLLAIEASKPAHAQQPRRLVEIEELPLDEPWQR
jgi:hypothetical protein